MSSGLMAEVGHALSACFILLSQFVSPCPMHVNSLTLMANSGHHKTISQRNWFEPKGQG